MKISKLLTLCASLALGLTMARPAAAADIIMDNTDASGVTITGAWGASTTISGFYGTNYLQDGNTGKGTKFARYTPTITTAGTYNVYARWTADPNRASNAPYTVQYSGGSVTVPMNQQANNGTWMLVGTYPFATGTSGYVEIANTGTTAVVVADAVMFSMAPQAPTGLQATAGDTQVSLSWTASSGATGYNVKRGSASGGPYGTTVASNISGTSFTNTGLTNGSGYYYVVTALNASGESLPTAEVAISPTNLPSPWQTKDIGAVGALGSVSFSGGIYTIVGAGADIGGTADAFRYVYQQATGDCTVIARVTSLQNTNALAKAGVMIRESDHADSIFSAVMLTPSTSNGIRFVNRSSTGGTPTVVTVTGIVAPYWVKLVRTGNSFAAFRAVDSSGTPGTWTGIGSAVSVTMASSVLIGFPVDSHVAGTLCTAVLDNVTPGIVAPPAPSGLGATAVSSSQINLSWTDNSTTETGFRIERKTGAGGTYAEIGTVGANVTTYNDTTGLSPSTTYYYQVRAYNAGGNSSYSASANATTAAAPPNAPSGITFDPPTTSAVTVRWTDNSSDETGFVVERSLTSGSGYLQVGSTTAADVTSFADSGLSTFTTYYYRVKATKAGLDSGYATEQSVKTQDAIPAAPSGVTINTAVTSNSIKVIWNDNSNGTIGVETSFKIERRTGSGSFTTIGTAPAGTTATENWTDTSVASGTSYSYRVSAVNATGSSSPSSAPTNVTTLGTAIATPGTPTLTPVDSDKIDVTIAANANDVLVERSTTGAVGSFTYVGTITAGQTVFHDTGLTGYTAYYYRVRATNSGGANNSPYTSSGTTTNTMIPAPSNLAATGVNSTQANLTWTDNSTNELHFSVERKLGVSGTYTAVASTAPNATTYLDTGLTADNDYYYRVRVPFIPGGNTGYDKSPYSSEIHVILLPAPTLTASVVSSTSIQLDWSGYPSPNETGFKIERRPDVGGAWTQIGTTAADVLTYTDTTGLSSGSTYVYRVRAYRTAAGADAGGDSDYSNVANSTTLLGGTLPSPWVHADVGTPPVAGDAGYSSGTFIIKGSGSDMYNPNSGYAAPTSSENFQYLYQPLTGDGTIVAHVTSMDRTVEWANTGVMIRETVAGTGASTSNFVYYALTAGYGHGTALFYRSAAGVANLISYGDGIGAPYWLKLIRSGNVFTAYKSVDNTTWVSVGSVTVPMASAVSIGIPVFSETSSTAKTVLDNVSVTSGGVPAAPTVPTSLPVSGITSSAMTVNWTDNSGNETGFRIERSSSGNPGTFAVIGTVGAGVQTFTDTGLTAGTTYYYQVIAYNSGGDGASAAVSATTAGGVIKSLLSEDKPCFADLVQTGQHAEQANDGDLTKTKWTAGGGYPHWWKVDLGASYPLSKVKIAWNNDGTFWWKYKIETSPDDTTYTLQVDKTANGGGSPADTMDTFSVTARWVKVTVTGCTATGKWSSFYECQVYRAGTEPAGASALTATTDTTFGANQINLTWTDNATNETGFKVERKVGAAGVWTQSALVPAAAGSGTTVNFADTGLAAGTQYYYRVLAYNDTDGDSSDYSNTPNATTATAGAFTREYYTGISGNTVAALTADSRFIANTPTATTTLNTFEAPYRWADSYGEKISGTITPPANGNYNFWIASDDDSELWLSTDATEANSVLIAQSKIVFDKPNGFTPPGAARQDWSRFVANPYSGAGNYYQNSAPIALQAGHTYYIKALHKADTGVDHVEVAWQGPGFTRQVIADNSSFMTSSITSPADGSTTSEGSNITINASATAGSGRSIARVEFLLNGDSQVEAKLGEDTTAPYSFTWNSVPNGSYIITERAWDTAGASTRASIRVTVTNGYFASGTWTDRILNGDGSINWTEYTNVANNYDRRDMVEYRLGPNYTYYHPTPGTFTTRDNQSGEGGVLGHPWGTNKESDWYSEGGQMIFSANASAATKYQAGVAQILNGDIYTWAGASPGYGYINGIQWSQGVNDEIAHGQSMPDPSVLRPEFKAANGGTVPPPVSTVRTGGAGGITGFLLFKNGFITGAGNGATDSYNSVPGDLPRYAFTQLAAGKVPTAGAVTVNTEFLLVTVWDTINHKGQVAVIAINGQIRAQQTALNNHQLGTFFWGLANRFTVRSLKVLGYIDLPAGMAAPSAISASDDLAVKDGVGDDSNVGLGTLLDSQAERDSWFVGTGNYKKAPKAGYAVVASRSENKVAFLDLQPLFAYYRSMYFTTQANYDLTKNQGPGDSQWPYTFAYAPSQTPTVAATISVTQPSAIWAGLPKNPNGGGGTTNAFLANAYIATMDGHFYIYSVGDLITTDSAVGPALVSTTTVGKNPTGLDNDVEFTPGVLLTCRGDKSIQLIDPSAITLSTLTDSRIVDPVYAAASHNGRGSYNMNLIHVMDFEGSQILTYRYGSASSTPPINDTTGFEYTHTDPLPGCPFMLTRMGVN